MLTTILGCLSVPAEAPPVGAPPTQAPPPFVPTREFQPLLPGQAVPPGLHIRMNLSTGQREAKLADDAPPTGTEVALVSQEGAGPSAQGAGPSTQGSGPSSQGPGPSWEERQQSGDNSENSKAEDIACK